MFQRTLTKFIVHTSFLLFLLFCILTNEGCSNGKGLSSGSEVTLKSTTFSFDRGTYPSKLDLFPTYTINPGDVLDVLFQVQTWRKVDTFRFALDHTVSVKFVNNPSLNETQRIQPDGKISLPYLGEVSVLGLTPLELSTELTRRYSKILRDPEIYITIPDFRSRINELKKDLHTSTRGLSRLVTVRPDGYATFPLIGDVFVARQAIPAVKGELDKKYQEFLPGLHVDLFLDKRSGTAIFVLGQVDKSGVHTISKPITVLEAISLAGGFTPGASPDKIVIFRRHEQNMIATRVDLEKTIDPGAQSEFFYLKPDDIVYVPKTGIAKIAEIMRDVKDALMFRGWGINIDDVYWRFADD